MFALFAQTWHALGTRPKEIADGEADRSIHCILGDGSIGSCRRRQLLVDVVARLCAVVAIPSDQTVGNARSLCGWPDQWHEHGVWGFDLGTGKPTKEQLFYWLDEYCRNNPLKDTSEAAAAFANQVTHDAYLHALMRHHATD
jgi:hypothetical protein